MSQTIAKIRAYVADKITLGYIHGSSLTERNND